MVPLSYNVRNLVVRKTSSITTALGIALVVWTLAASSMLNESIHRTLGSSGKATNALVLRKGSDAELASNIENANVGLILAAPGVKTDAEGKPLGTAEAVVVIALGKTGEAGKVSNASVRGVQDNVLSVRPGVRIIAGRPAQPGTDEAIIGTRIRGRLDGLELGKSFDIKKNRPITVVGVFEHGGSSFESEIWTDIETVRDSFGRQGLVSSVTVQLESTSKFDTFSATVENDKQLGLEAMREDEYYEKQSEGLTLFISIIAMVFTVAFAIGAMIGAVITMFAAVAQRRREIGTLLALGFSRTSIMLSFLFESSFLALVGGAFGVLISLSLTFFSFSMVNFATWSEIVFTFDPTPGILVKSVIIGAIMGLLGGFLPALSAARTSPVLAMRD
jgi:putative ABC transport system permease protein